MLDDGIVGVLEAAGFLARVVFGFVFIVTGELTLRLLTFFWRTGSPRPLKEWLHNGWDFELGLRWFVGVLVWGAVLALFTLAS